MYRNIINGLLLSGCISSIVISQEMTTPKIDVPTMETGPAAPGVHSATLRATEQLVTEGPPSTEEEQTGPAAPGVHSATLRATEQSVTKRPPTTGREQTGARKQMEHAFSEAVMIVIIFGVMTAIVLFILLLAYSIRRLSERSAVPVQSAFPQNADDPLSSVETGNPE